MYGFDNKYPYTDFHELNLDWILKQISEMSGSSAEIKTRLDKLELDNQAMMQLYDDIMAGDFPDAIKNAFYEWMRDNAVNLVGDLVHMVFFGLNNDGYFVAYIPENWNDIIFGTSGLDDFPTGIEYGHLTLSY